MVLTSGFPRVKRENDLNIVSSFAVSIRSRPLGHSPGTYRTPFWPQADQTNTLHIVCHRDLLARKVPYLLHSQEIDAVSRATGSA